jgi:hypothetical protein
LELHLLACYLLPDVARGDLQQVANELWVDGPTLGARLDPRHLHCTERAFLRQRFAREYEPA